MRAGVIGSGMVGEASRWPGLPRCSRRHGLLQPPNPDGDVVVAANP
jgi:hypothetical protein